MAHERALRAGSFQFDMEIEADLSIDFYADKTEWYFLDEIQ